MLDINLLREKPQEVEDNLRRRNDERALATLKEVIEADKGWRRALQELNELQHQRNLVAREVGMKKKRSEDASDLVRQASEISTRIEGLEARTAQFDPKVKEGLLRLPNLLHESVPVGKGAEDNVEIRRWGKPRTFAFDLKAHGELLEALGLADFERGRKVTGAGFNYLKGAAALLDQALMRFALDFLVKKGFTAIEVPEMLLREAYQGMVDLADFENVMYKIEGQDSYLIATSEHAIGAMYMDEVLDEASLPQRFAGISVNFRKEIGAHGVDTRGLFRMHQFNKIEQFIFSKPEDSWVLHEEMLVNTEAICRKLRIPYRVVALCGADTGKVMAKTYDIEAWSPRQNKFTELMSVSNATDYQARRLRVRLGKMGGTKRLAHTLNGTAVATSRAMVAIVENFQNAERGFDVPQVLRPYMGGLATVGRAIKAQRRPKASTKRRSGRGRRA